MRFFSPFASFKDEKLLYYNKYYNKQIKTHDNVNVQSHDQQQSKLNSSNTKSGSHTFADGKITKSSFKKNNVATIKSK